MAIVRSPAKGKRKEGYLLVRQSYREMVIVYWSGWKSRQGIRRIKMAHAGIGNQLLGELWESKFISWRQSDMLVNIYKQSTNKAGCAPCQRSHRSQEFKFDYVFHLTSTWIYLYWARSCSCGTGWPNSGVFVSVPERSAQQSHRDSNHQRIAY